MTVERFYNVVGGNYQKILQNLRQDDKVVRFAKMFLEDPSYQELSMAMDVADYQAAFAAAHKLKGICQNMYFERMLRIVHEITESLRNETDIATAEALMPQLEDIYELTVEGIRELDEA